jgi:hypothetical protein
MRERYVSILHLKSIRLADPDGRRAIAGCGCRLPAQSRLDRPSACGDGRPDHSWTGLQLGSTLMVKSTPEGTHTESSMEVPRAAPLQNT